MAETRTPFFNFNEAGLVGLINGVSRLFIATLADIWNSYFTFISMFLPILRRAVLPIALTAAVGNGAAELMKNFPAAAALIQGAEYILRWLLWAIFATSLCRLASGTREKGRWFRLTIREIRFSFYALAALAPIMVVSIYMFGDILPDALGPVQAARHFDLSMGWAYNRLIVAGFLACFLALIISAPMLFTLPLAANDRKGGWARHVRYAWNRSAGDILPFVFAAMVIAVPIHLFGQMLRDWIIFTLLPAVAPEWDGHIDFLGAIHETLRTTEDFMASALFIILVTLIASRPVERSPDQSSGSNS